MPRGLLVHVYRQRLGDCTNGGISSKFDSFILVGPGIPEIFEAREEVPVLYLMKGSITGQPIAKPSLDDKIWWMFGGNFVYTSDSRFPSEQPIKIFDRRE